jgi:para-nitrobenzyl esterase
VARGFFAHLGLAAGDVGTLQAMPFAGLFDQFQQFLAGGFNAELPGAAQWLLSPVVDGVHLPAHPWDPASPVGRDVPLIIGTNKDEAALTLAQAPDAGQLTEQALLERIRAVLGARSEAVLAAHRRSRPQETPWEALATISSEDRRLLSIEIATGKAAQRAAPVYMYYFTWESNFGFFRAAHTMEIPFVFRNLDATSVVGTREDRHALSDVMSNAWLAFSRNGDPNHAGVPVWRPYDTESRATMIFDSPSRLENDPRREERLAWGNERVPMPWEGGSFVASVASGGLVPKASKA